MGSAWQKEEKNILQFSTSCRWWEFGYYRDKAENFLHYLLSAPCKDYDNDDEKLHEDRTSYSFSDFFKEQSILLSCIVVIKITRKAFSKWIGDIQCRAAWFNAISNGNDDC